MRNDDECVWGGGRRISLFKILEILKIHIYINCIINNKKLSRIWNDD